MRKKLLSMGTMLMAASMMMIPATTASAAELVGVIEESNPIEEIMDEVPTVEDENIIPNLSDDAKIPENNFHESKIEDTNADESMPIEPRWTFTKKYKVTASSLNIRSKASTSGDVVGTLYKGDVINVKSIDNGWAKFKYNDQWRYVSATYIKAVK